MKMIESVDINDLVKGLTLTLKIKITGQREFRVRIWCATQLLRLVACVLGCGISIDIELH